MLKNTLIAFTFALLTACVTVPQAVLERTARDPQSRIAAQCHAGTPDHVVASHDAPGLAVLDPDRFRLLNWNAFKGESSQWLKVFAQYSSNQDLITLQEAYLSDNFRALLRDQGLQWDLATAFHKQHHEAGVMTLSRTAPEGVCVQRTMEPWLSLPKSTLLSRFRLRGRADTLLVANIHSVNFTLGTGSFESQLSKMAKVLKKHRGPIILAGDFNTWNDARVEILKRTVVDPLLLDKVHFNPTYLKTVFEHNLDYVFYRNLKVLAKEARETRVSDHNPMWVTFRVLE